jgi:hypothetical protein
LRQTVVLPEPASPVMRPMPRSSNRVFESCLGLAEGAGGKNPRLRNAQRMA